MQKHGLADVHSSGEAQRSSKNFKKRWIAWVKGDDPTRSDGSTKQKLPSSAKTREPSSESEFTCDEVVENAGFSASPRANDQGHNELFNFSTKNVVDGNCCPSLCSWCRHRQQVFLDLGWMPEEVKLFWLLLSTATVGSVCAYNAWVIPYEWSEVLGISAVALSVGLFVLLMKRDARWLERTPFLVPPGLFMICFNYISLAEAVDQDSGPLALEDALEVAVETNVLDR